MTETLHFRYDSAEIKKPRKTSNGFLEFDACIARVGVLEYWDEEKGDIRREYVPKETLFDPESLKDLELVTATNEHPEEMITPENSKDHSVGYIQKGVRIIDDGVWATFLVTDKQAIEDILSRRRTQVSPGYRNQQTPAPMGAVYNGKPYDIIQTKRFYNHVAITDAGRAGKSVAIKMDSASDRTDSALVGINNIFDGEKPMSKVNINGVEYDASESLATALKIKFDSDEKEMKEAEDSKESLEKKIDEAEARVDQLKKEKKDMEDKAKKDSESAEEDEKEKKDSIDKAVKKRVRVMTSATEILGNEEAEKFDSLTNAEIMSKVIKHEDESADLEGKTNDYLHARFDSVCSYFRKRNGDVRSQASKFDSKHNKDANSADSSLSARAKMIEDMKTGK